MSRLPSSMGISGYKVLKHTTKADCLEIELQAPQKRPSACTRCSSTRIQSKGFYERRVRHTKCFGASSRLRIRCRRFKCRDCKLSFTQPLPGILAGKHSTQPFGENIYTLHHEGISGSVMGRLEKLGCATVSRICSEFTERKASERLSLECPLMLGIDEHTLHKNTKFATTFCDLANNRIFDIVEGKSAAYLEGFLSTLKGREKVKMVCIDLCSAYRSLVRRYFPNAILVADRFHVVRVVLHHFIQLARELAPEAFVRRGAQACCAKRPRSYRLRSWSALKLCFKTTQCSGLSIRKCLRSAICSI